ncbi:hypothetical protein NC652_027626 [Populus alba x Populus x berolinensis]|nr:hypothetical protein NC652_027626 [Populus alba x Populus x berolinensis]
MALEGSACDKRRSSLKPLTLSFDSIFLCINN